MCCHNTWCAQPSGSLRLRRFTSERSRSPPSTVGLIDPTPLKLQTAAFVPFLIALCHQWPATTTNRYWFWLWRKRCWGVGQWVILGEGGGIYIYACIHTYTHVYTYNRSESTDLATPILHYSYNYMSKITNPELQKDIVNDEYVHTYNCCSGHFHHTNIMQLKITWLPETPHGILAQVLQCQFSSSLSKCNLHVSTTWVCILCKKWHLCMEVGYTFQSNHITCIQNHCSGHLDCKLTVQVEDH